MAASCGTCASCAFPGFQGTCHPVGAGGADPTGTCVDDAAVDLRDDRDLRRRRPLRDLPGRHAVRAHDLLGVDADDLHVQRRGTVRAPMHDGLHAVRVRRHHRLPADCACTADADCATPYVCNAADLQSVSGSARDSPSGTPPLKSPKYGTREHRRKKALRISRLAPLGGLVSPRGAC